jgi:hypothetical protein
MQRALMSLQSRKPSAYAAGLDEKLDEKSKKHKEVRLRICEVSELRDPCSPGSPSNT